MKVVAVLVSLLFLSACGAQYENMSVNERAKDFAVTAEEDSAEAPEAPMEGVPEVAMNRNTSVMEIMNFRTSDSLTMESETRILRSYEEFTLYNETYTILENPFFIDDESLSKLSRIDEEYFRTKALVVVVMVESSGSNRVSGENLIMKGNVAEAFIQRQEAEIGTMDIATRHVLFSVSQEELQGVTEVKVTTGLSIQR
ncbi:MAG TPA: hypothetical protein DEA52_05760 [Clostridiaceae bacterium]|nr:hypothetical protein [Clostridiaceae bacterium]